MNFTPGIKYNIVSIFRFSYHQVYYQQFIIKIIFQVHFKTTHTGYKIKRKKIPSLHPSNSTLCPPRENSCYFLCLVCLKPFRVISDTLLCILIFCSSISLTPCPILVHKEIFYIFDGDIVYANVWNTETYLASSDI